MEHDDRPTPWCRATIAGADITLHRWTPALLQGGPAAMTLERLACLGVVLADLACEGEPGAEELFVRWVTRHEPAAAEPVLLGWARTVGYRRVWLPDRVVDNDVAASPLGMAATTCRTCGLGWRDDTPQFWRRVRDAGAFPGSCPACGGSLPEWRVAPGVQAEAPVAAIARSPLSDPAPPPRASPRMRREDSP